MWWNCRLPKRKDLTTPSNIKCNSILFASKNVGNIYWTSQPTTLITTISSFCPGFPLTSSPCLVLAWGFSRILDVEIRLQLDPCSRTPSTPPFTFGQLPLRVLSLCQCVKVSMTDRVWQHVLAFLFLFNGAFSSFVCCNFATSPESVLHGQNPPGCAHFLRYCELSDFKPLSFPQEWNEPTMAFLGLYVTSWLDVDQH